MYTYFNYEVHVAKMPQGKRYRKTILLYNSSGKENQNYYLIPIWKIFYIKSKLNIDLKYSKSKTKQKCLKEKKKKKEWVIQKFFNFLWNIFIYFSYHY